MADYSQPAAQPVNATPGLVPGAGAAPAVANPAAAAAAAAAATPGAAPGGTPAAVADPLLEAIQKLTENLKGNPTAADDGKGTPDRATNYDTFDVTGIEDPAVRSMASALKVIGKGLDLNRVMAKAIETGNAEFIDRAYLKEKSPELADDIIGLAEGIVTSIEAQSEARVTSVHTKAGGKESWDAASAAFSKGAPASLKLAVKTMFDSGNVAHIDAAAELVIAYAQQNGAIAKVAGSVQAGTARASAQQGISKVQFQTELFKLNQNHSNDRDYTERRADLFNRRKIGQQAGI